MGTAHRIRPGNHAMNKARHLVEESHRHATRRWFLKQCGVGLGSIALHELLSGKAQAATPTAPSSLQPKPPLLPSKAKRVIYLYMGGAPSQLELFDNKPHLAK